MTHVVRMIVLMTMVSSWLVTGCGEVEHADEQTLEIDGKADWFGDGQTCEDLECPSHATCQVFNYWGSPPVPQCVDASGNIVMPSESDWTETWDEPSCDDIECGIYQHCEMLLACDDEGACFDFAGCVDDPPTEEELSWCDQLSCESYGQECRLVIEYCFEDSCPRRVAECFAQTDDDDWYLPVPGATDESVGSSCNGVCTYGAFCSDYCPSGASCRMVIEDDGASYWEILGC